MRRGSPAVLLGIIVCALAAVGAAPASRAAEPEWHSEQPVSAGIGVPVPIGSVGDIAFWAPNRGILITSGNHGMPAGIYAYDGTVWYLYSNVCGGHQGSVAWAGPDEFWTVSDYGEAQEGSAAPFFETKRTLCHFKDGEVVASFAEPLASSDAYAQMNAAACAGPSNCWFAGERLPQTAANQGAFHLHWDGSSLTAIPSPTGVEPELANLPGRVEDLTFFRGRLLESATEAPLLREVVAPNPKRFLPVEYPAGTAAPFRLSSDPEQQQLWAADREGGVMRLGSAGFETVLAAAGPLFDQNAARGKVEALGAEADGAAAWLGGGGSVAEVRQVGIDGALGPIISLPQPGEELSDKGGAEQIACPAVGQCWMVTTEGWLFHLGVPLAPNADPALHKLITSRPADDSTRSFVPAGIPEDNSGEEELERSEQPLREQIPTSRKRRALVVKVRQRIVDKTLLQLSFTLRARAHVRLVAKRHKNVVAKTPRLTLGKGRRRIRLRLDPKHWPTSLDFQAHPAGKQGTK